MPPRVRSAFYQISVNQSNQWYLSPLPFEACENAAPVAWEELALVGAVGIFDHAGGGGVSLVRPNPNEKAAHLGGLEAVEHSLRAASHCGGEQ
jgi:hypothetical protein